MTMGARRQKVQIGITLNANCRRLTAPEMFAMRVPRLLMLTDHHSIAKHVYQIQIAGKLVVFS